MGSPKMRKRPKSLSVPAAGKKYWGLSRNGSYAAAQRGDIPVPGRSALNRYSALSTRD